MSIASTLAQNARLDPFYSFNRFQKQANRDMTTSPVIGGPNGYLENNQNAAYNRYLASIGIGQTDTNPFAEYARKQFGQTQTGYQTALAEDPTMRYQDYLTRLGFRPLYNQFMQLSPQQRGENRSRYVGPVRTIADI